MDAAVLAEQTFFLGHNLIFKKTISEVTILDVAAQNQKSGSPPPLPSLQLISVIPLFLIVSQHV